MADDDGQSDMRRRQVTAFAAALSSFSSSTDNLRILTSIPQQQQQNSSPSPPPSPPPPPSALYVLDSSFNPPTLAHLRIATSALAQDHHPQLPHHNPDGPAPPKRLLLLLATRNADKAPQPAAFEQRLALMAVLADDVRKAYVLATTAGHEPAVIDVGVTKHPMFIDKASAIAASGFYPPDTTQVHLTGYDTLVRILDPKYYPPAHTLAPLGPFLSRHRLRVTYRTDGSWGGMAEQEAFLKALADGEMEAEGGMKEWAERIELVEGRKEGELVISSTRARGAVRSGDRDLLQKLVSEGVADWVLHEKLYVNDEC